MRHVHDCVEKGVKQVNLLLLGLKLPSEAEFDSSEWHTEFQAVTSCSWLNIYLVFEEHTVVHVFDNFRMLWRYGTFLFRILQNLLRRVLEDRLWTTRTNSCSLMACRGKCALYSLNYFIIVVVCSFGSWMVPKRFDILGYSWKRAKVRRCPMRNSGACSTYLFL